MTFAIHSSDGKSFGAGMATREFCDHCGNVNAVGFTVPDSIWCQVAPSNCILCLACFAIRADDLNLEWDKDIQFWPVSKVTLNAHG